MQHSCHWTSVLWKWVASQLGKWSPMSHFISQLLLACRKRQVHCLSPPHLRAVSHNCKAHLQRLSSNRWQWIGVRTGLQERYKPKKKVNETVGNFSIQCLQTCCTRNTATRMTLQPTPGASWVSARMPTVSCRKLTVQSRARKESPHAGPMTTRVGAWRSLPMKRPVKIEKLNAGWPWYVSHDDAIWKGVQPDSFWRVDLPCQWLESYG